MTLSMLYSSFSFTFSKFFSGDLNESENDGASFPQENGNFTFNTMIDSNGIVICNGNHNNNNDVFISEEDKNDLKRLEEDIKQVDEEEEEEEEEFTEAEEYFEGEEGSFSDSLAVLPFTLKNMAKRYVNDLEWPVEYEGIRWTFYLHVPFYQKGEFNTVAYVGIKIKNIEEVNKSSKRSSYMSSNSGSSVDLQNLETVVSQQLSRNSSDSSYQSQKENDSSLTAPSTCPSSRGSFDSLNDMASKTFEASWEIRCSKNKKLIASCSPSVYSIEKGEEYLVEFADDEFNFADQLNNGLVISLKIRTLNQSD